MQPLQNMRVLDLSRVLAGPYCTMVLAAWAARIQPFLQRIILLEFNHGYYFHRVPSQGFFGQFISYRFLPRPRSREFTAQLPSQAKTQGGLFQTPLARLHCRPSIDDRRSHCGCHFQRLPIRG
ncbi:MAG: hypothetical protein DCC59_08430 [Chloroflexi bacterium]|nr:CoA transferase [Anaerolineales bacterium]MCE7918954.1 hypothetical protein [Chloroflexi bacterium CFX1]MCQ3952067.1 hypothetical protein [Chloroflexota bacterium]MDL1919437.1 hypothetical protein [Chloroflexi bacterium CFX5]NUQ57877.1 CoA transferase [Anaerolineales bacterium]